MLSALPVVVLTALVAATAADADVAEGLSLYQRLKYDRAVVVLGRALTKSDLSRDDRARALETLGFAYTVLGDAVNAELTFHALLDLDPRYDVAASLSPRLRSGFAQAKSSWQEGRHVTFRLTSPDDAKELVGKLEDGDVRRVGIVETRDANGKTSPLVCKDRECRGDRPKTTFSVDVFDHAGSVLHTAGPFTPAERGVPWWLVAAGVGAAVVAGGIVIGVAASGHDAPEGSLGRLQLP